jgi:hypothetical protein
MAHGGLLAPTASEEWLRAVTRPGRTSAQEKAATIRKPEYVPGSGDAAGAVSLLRRESIWHLGGADGCLCANFEILGYRIVVACRKSSLTVGEPHTLVEVASRLDVSSADLALVAKEVKRQCAEAESHIPVRVKCHHIV